MIKKVGLDTERVHNDSTTVKTYGKIPGTTRTGLKMARGVSKDHRPDLAQLVFSLTVSSDGVFLFTTPLLQLKTTPPKEYHSLCSK